MNTNYTFIFLAISIFVAVFSFCNEFLRADKVKEKNLDLLAIQLPDADEDVLAEKKDFLQEIYEKYYNSKFLQANLRISYKEFKTFVCTLAVTTIIVLVFATVVFSPIFTIMVSALIIFLVYAAPNLYINVKISQRRLAINAQAADVLSIMSSCSSTQMPLDKTFKVLSERLAEPCSGIFLEAYELMSVGESAEDVLKHLKKMLDSNDFNFLLGAYQVWIENQGSMKDTYQIAQRTIRDKEEINLSMESIISGAKINLIVVVVLSIFFVVMSLVTISDIFVPFSQSLLGQVSIILSFLILFFGIYQINKLKNSVKY